MSKNHFKYLTWNDLKMFFLDKKSLFMVVLVTLIIYPLLIVGTFKTQEMKKETTITIGIPSDFSMKDIFLSNKNLKVEEYTDKNKADFDVIVLQKGKNITIDYKSSSLSSQSGVQIVSSIIQGSNNSYLKSSNLKDNLINIDLVDIATKNESNFIIDMIPYILVFGIFFGCTTIAVASITGEKEKKTINYLLAVGMETKIIAISKFLSTMIIGLTTLSLSIVGLYIASVVMTRMQPSYSSIDMSFSMIINILFELLLLTIEIASIICLISISSKTMKEANAIITPFNLLIMIGGIMVSMSELNPFGQKIVEFIPIINSIQILAFILKNDFTMNSVIVSRILSILVTIAILLIYVNRYSKEKYLL